MSDENSTKPSKVESPEERVARLVEDAHRRITQSSLERYQNESSISETPRGTANPVFNGGYQAPEQTELTVDLPEGQKLTLKGIEPGTIVEVASWSGKSGPTDSAIRMLFGASAPEPDQTLDESGPKSQKNPAEEAVDVVPTDGLVHASGVEGTLHPEDSAIYSNSRRQSVPQKSTKWKKVLKRIIFFSLGVLLLIGTVLGLRATDILYFVTPDSGLSTGLGGANTSIAAVNPQAHSSPDSTIIAEVDGRYVMVGVAEVGEDKLLVFTGSERLVVPIEDVIGRVIFVIPFLGYLSFSI